MSKNSNSLQTNCTAENKKVILHLSQLIKQLASRFSWRRIINEKVYIKNMNSKMEIQINPFFNDRDLKNKTKQQIINILKEVPVFKLIYKKEQKNAYAFPKVKVNYENSDRILLITGICKNYIQMFIQQYKKSGNYDRSNNILSEKNFEHWHIVQLLNAESALVLKKLIRNAKRAFDEKNNQSYKISKRKVRIVLLNEDFFAILTDMMTDRQSSAMLMTFGKEPYKNLFYTPLQFQGKQTKKVDENQIMFYDDTVSEQFKSKSSDFNDINGRLRQIDIQTKNQEIQFGDGLIESQNLVKEQIQSQYNLHQCMAKCENPIMKIQKQEQAKQQKEEISEQKRKKQILLEQKQKQYFQAAQKDISNTKSTVNKSKSIIFRQDVAQSSLQKNTVFVSQQSHQSKSNKNSKTSIQGLTRKKSTSIPKNLNKQKKKRKNNKQKDLTESPSLRNLKNQDKSQQNTCNTSQNLKKNKKVQRQESRDFWKSSTNTLFSQQPQQTQIKRPIQLNKQLTQISNLISTPTYNKRIRQQTEEEKGQQFAQYSYTMMKKMNREYAKKDGRTFQDIPPYIKKRSLHLIYKQRFFEKVITYANRSVFHSMNDIE